MAETIPPEISPSPNSNTGPKFAGAGPSQTSSPPAAALAAEEAANLYPYRFQRTDQWKPVYTWLESLDSEEVVTAKDIADWLAANPDARAKLFSRHSRYHMTHYIQRLHVKLLKKRGRIPKTSHYSTTKAIVKTLRGKATTQSIPSPRSVTKDSQMLLYKRTEASLRYELLTDLEKQLTSILSKHKHSASLQKSQSHSVLGQRSENDASDQSCKGLREEPAKNLSQSMSCSEDFVSFNVAELAEPTAVDANIGQKSKMNPNIAISAWSSSGALLGTSQSTVLSSSHCEGSENIIRGDTVSSSSQRAPSRKNIVMCLQGRERGLTWPVACSHRGYAGRQKEKWIPYFKGWRSLGRSFEGSAMWFERRSYYSWMPTWCAYGSSAPVPYPHSRQGVQKILKVRFHPEGLPQLVCSSNEVPNELLLYNLLSGRAVQLKGHNCQIQAMDFAVRGASVVSCGDKLLKVWDCITGSCLFTLGCAVADGSSFGHNKNISSMAVNFWQSCLVATSGGFGDGKLLLWNALRGELSADLNLNLRSKEPLIPCISTMDFCSENHLLCGSDCSHGGLAVVQLWDMESPNLCQSFTARDSDITSAKLNPLCNTIITGSGDGTVGLFDPRTHELLTYLSIGTNCEVTSVSVSNCGTYFSAASTSNCTFVWDVRLMPMKKTDYPLERSTWTKDAHFFRPLHRLSHGKQMPTAENAHQVPGHVREGDQGINDACWLQREPILVTVSGDGSMAMWDVNLGQPCVRRIVAHSRCVNTVAASPNDDYLCSGGDDQKIVLYHNSRGRAHLSWRLSHPLTERDSFSGDRSSGTT